MPSQALILKEELFPSHDGLYHILRIEEFHQSIVGLNIPPRLAPGLYGGIGYPLFVVNYQIPYYLTEVFLLFSNNSAFAYKGVISLTFILSGTFAYMLFRKIGSRPASLTGAMLYSYYLIDSQIYIPEERLVNVLR